MGFNSGFKGLMWNTGGNYTDTEENASAFAWKTNVNCPENEPGSRW